MGFVEAHHVYARAFHRDRWGLVIGCARVGGHGSYERRGDEARGGRGHDQENRHASVSGRVVQPLCESRGSHAAYASVFQICGSERDSQAACTWWRSPRHLGWRGLSTPGLRKRVVEVRSQAKRRPPRPWLRRSHILVGPSYS